MDDIFLVVGVRAKPGKENQLRDDLVALVEPSRRENGNIRYDLLEDVNEPGQFVFVEHWESAEAQAHHHNHGEHIKKFHEDGDQNIDARNFIHVLRSVT